MSTTADVDGLQGCGNVRRVERFNSEKCLLAAHPCEFLRLRAIPLLFAGGASAYEAPAWFARIIRSVAILASQMGVYMRKAVVVVGRHHAGKSKTINENLKHKLGIGK